METNLPLCDLHVYDAHGVDIGELNTVSEVVKYINETGYARIAGYFVGAGNKKVSFELTINSPNN